VSDWTTEEDRQLQQLYGDGACSWESVADNMADRTAEGCRKRFHRLEPDDDLVVDAAEVLTDEVTWQERLSVAKSVQRIRKGDELTAPIAERTIITDKPFGIWFTADWHLGSVGTDMDTWQQHMARFFGIDNLSMFLVGDMIANIATHKFVLPVFQQVMTPEEQGLLIGSILKDLVDRKKLEAVVLTEEHDQRDARMSGVSFLRQIVRPLKSKIAFLDNRGQVIFWIGPDKDNLIAYVVHACHKSRYNSFLNALHASSREARLDIMANVVVTAHTHRPAMGWYNWMQGLHDVLQFADQDIILGEEVFCIQCGTYEQHAQYGLQMYGSLPTPKVQGLVFDPHKRNIEMAKSFDAMEKLLKV